MAKLNYAEDALNDLDEIAAFSLANWGRARSNRYVADLRAACRLLARNPFLGPACDHFRPGMRRKVQGSHTIFYLITTNGVRIARILHHSMSPGLHLPDDEA